LRGLSIDDQVWLYALSSYRYEWENILGKGLKMTQDERSLYHQIKMGLYNDDDSAGQPQVRKARMYSVVMAERLWTMFRQERDRVDIN
jgi:hypothetical protein